MTAQPETREFVERLRSKLDQCQSVQFGFENASVYVKREFTINPIKATIKRAIKSWLYGYQIRFTYKAQFDRLLVLLNASSQELLIELLTYRIKGFRKVKLSVNRPSYWKQMQELETLAGQSSDDVVMIFSGLKRFDLRKFGYNITIDYTVDGVMMDFILEQYACKSADEVEASQGDVVLDLGGCWGDTALYFAEKVGDKGHVHSFEFIPRNVAVFRSNLKLNTHLEPRVTLVEHPVFNSSGCSVYYRDKGQGSKVSMRPFKNMTGTTKTMSIDDYVRMGGLKVDFIKMDIEGAELLALEGARETIVKFKPKLAIAIYHSIGDMARIPNWIEDLNLGYKLQLGHYTIHEDETVCFARI